MFDQIVVATDGSASVERAIEVALDLARRFDAEVYVLSVVDESEISSSPEEIRDELRSGLQENGQNAVADVAARATRDVVTEVREGRPATEIAAYAGEVDADAVATGTRGRHGENRFLIGSVAERVVRTCSVPVLTVRQLESEDTEADVSA